MIYLKSVESYQGTSDEFNFNYGMCKSALGQYKEAEENLLLVTNERYQADYAYLSWLARCYIYNDKPKSAWELYLRMETSSDSFSLLQLIANDCYLKVCSQATVVHELELTELYLQGAFFYSAKAFDVLERLDPNPEYWEGKRGACVGLFQAVVAGKEQHDQLRDIVSMLRNTNNPQVEYIIRIIKKWARENGVKL
jgi:intraflagellar transport protein 56